MSKYVKVIANGLYFLNYILITGWFCKSLLHNNLIYNKIYLNFSWPELLGAKEI